jgi:hypothetical protein
MPSCPEGGDKRDKTDETRSNCSLEVRFLPLQRPKPLTIVEGFFLPKLKLPHRIGFGKGLNVSFSSSSRRY